MSAPTETNDDVLLFANHYEFFEQYVAVVFRRPLSNPQLNWCDRWFAHTEADIRMDQLHRSFEHARRAGATSLDRWYLQTFVPMMRALMEPGGTFDGCRPSWTNSQAHHVHRVGRDARLPCSLSKDVVRSLARPPISDPDAPKPRFTNEYEFVEQFVSVMWRRKLDYKYRFWCPMWFAHPEALTRITLMHRSFEEARLEDPASGVCAWILSSGDPHMRDLMSPEGPFSGCKRGIHHSPNKQKRALPYSPSGKIHRVHYE